MESTVTIPLLKDHHSHPLFYSAFNHAISLNAVQDKRMAEAILSHSFENQTGGLTVAHGWRSNHYHWSQAEIERMPPLAVFNVSLHSLIINRGGMNFLRLKYGDVVNQIADPIWYENNLRVVLNWFANLYASRENLSRFFVQLKDIGIHYLEEMLLVDENEIRIFEDCNLLNRTRFWSAPDTFHSLSPEAKTQVHGLKLFTDGAIGSESAALHRPFLGGEGTNRGMLIYSDSELASTIDHCLETEKSLAIHAIGDRAIEQTVSTLKQLTPRLARAPEIRIEHAQLITEEQARVAIDLGIKLCMQPNFSSDSSNYADRLDQAYCIGNNPFRMLIDKVGYTPGENLILGSDGMPHGIESAAHHSFFPKLPSQQISIPEFIAAYCLDDFSMGSINLKLDESMKTIKYDILSIERESTGNKGKMRID
ncbi:amidohydrolase family protein [Mariniblastus sp.]|nr:amidohydrolase family protein [Mariniblastus sp.]